MIPIIHIFEDSIAEGTAKLMAASMPFITIGLLGNPTVTYISVATGLVAMIALIIRVSLLMANKRGITRDNIFNNIIGDLLSFPYAIALSSAILMTNGIDATSGLWFAGILGVMETAVYIPKKKI